MTHTAPIADRIAREARRLGYEARGGGSRLSASRYIEAYIRCAACAGETDGECECGPTLKIRISDHELPPTYGALNGHADYDVIVGSGANRPEAHGDWLECLEWLARRADRPQTPTMRTARTKRDHEAAALAEHQMAAAARRQAIIDEEAAREMQRRAWNPERWAEIAGIPGAKGREKRRVYRRQADAALGFPRP